MGRRSKQAGSRWEREAAKELSKYKGKWKRVPGSGALGTIMNDASLQADVVGEYPWWHNEIRAEAKYGYGGKTQITLKREWLDKIREEAKGTDSFPCLLLKMRDVISGDRNSAKLICFNFDTWNNLMEEIGELWEEYQNILDDIELERNS